VSQIVIPDLALVLLVAADPALVERVRLGAFGQAERASLETLGQRLAHRDLTVLDASGFSRDELRRATSLAADHYVRSYAIAIAPDRDVLGVAQEMMRRHLGSIAIKECFAGVADALQIERVRVVTDRRGEAGAFDIIGDVHGCADELIELLGVLGYRVAWTGQGEARQVQVTPPSGRRAAFVGDLVDRGPNSPDVLRIVMAMVREGSAICVAGNHDAAFLRWLEKPHNTLSHGLDQTVAQFAGESAEFRGQVQAFLAGLNGHAWVDGGALAVAHAGVLEPMIGRATGRVRAFTLYGDTSGKAAADGLPTRYHWALDYVGATTVAYGHTPVPEAHFVNNTVCLDTGCCFGGQLTAMRWPEQTFVTVAARATYATRGRPFGHPPARPKV
jgi:Calcineurin-like phosphoesterase